VRAHVRLFAAARDALAASELDLELPDGTTAGQLLAVLAERGGPLLLRCTVAIDRTAGPPQRVLPAGAELAVLPPVSGGAQLLRLGPEPIRAEAVLAALADPDLGGQVLFLGTVRGRTDAEQTAELEYEAYEAMALGVLEDIASRAAHLWPGVQMALWHRTGVLQPGEAAVAVAAAAVHRGDAFAAARFGIERLKAELPVWKRERGVDGATRWVAHP